ncbi:hypothetical protein U6B65_10455 [Oscillospiraceae bacterium MB08-C2-2]|nr:hypothetical protein U6B65_10455 [Oscillospiraceae bacterium MB08-C2-2]
MRETSSTIRCLHYSQKMQAPERRQRKTSFLFDKRKEAKKNLVPFPALTSQTIKSKDGAA